MTTMAGPADLADQSLFTCMSCSMAFISAEEQRIHFRSDHHRYNMKRRVASLPPVSAIVFNQKVLDRRQETSIMASVKGSVCEVCNKTYTTENAYRSHINSKKHKDAELKAASRSSLPTLTPSTSAREEQAPDAPDAAPSVEERTEKAGPSQSGTEEAEKTEEEDMRTLEEKLAAARSRMSIKDCLFCSQLSFSLEDNLTHMASVHSFFVPDADYLVDLPGLVTYLGEKIAVGNVCIYCNAKSRDFRTVEAVRKHMVDKTHCKIAYDTQADRLEVSDYYDFSSSYPDADRRKRSASKKKAKLSSMDDGALNSGSEEDEWEDMENDNESADEVVDEEASAVPASSSDESDSDESIISENELTYGDTPYELVLPSGARIGHRSMKRYYDQSLTRTFGNRDDREDPKSGAALVRQLIADKNSALVPRKGGFGAFGSGTEVVKARNRGEAREAGRHIREFRDQRKREEHKTRIGYVNNSQKHFRDPLLQ